MSERVVESKGIEVMSLLHVLAGVSLGISIAMGPGPAEAGAGTMLVLVALATLLDGLLARRATRRRAVAKGLWSGESAVAYPLLVTCLLAFFFIKRRIMMGGSWLWLSCAAFAMACALWRDYDDVHLALSPRGEGWSRPRLFGTIFSMAPIVYYLLFAIVDIPATAFWTVSAALFHGAMLLSRRMLEGPLRRLVLEPADQAIERLLREVETTRLSVSPDDEAVDEVPEAPTTAVDEPEETKAGEEIEPDVLGKIEAGLSAWEKGENGKALDLFLDVVSQNPDLEEPTLWAVQLVEKEGLPDRARELLVEYLRRHRESYSGFFRLGRLLADAGKVRLAQRAFKKASLLNDSSAAPLRELARLAASAGETERALYLARQVLERDEADGWAVDFVCEMEHLDRRRTVTALREEARTLLARRERGEALRVLKEIATVEPTDTETNLRSARILLDTGDPDKAVSVFEEALSLPFEHREGHELPVELARAYLSRGERRRALDELERSTRHFPLHLDLAFLRIDALLAEECRDGLEEYLEAARSAAAVPEELLMGAHLLLAGEAYDFPPRADVSTEVEALLRRAFEARGPSAPYEVTERWKARSEELWARNLARKGALKEAAVTFERALEFDPRSLVARRALAQVCLDSGEPEQSVVHYECLVRQQPNEAAWREGLLLALRATAQAAGRGEEYYRTLLQQKRYSLNEAPDSAMARYELGMVMSLFGCDDPSIRRGAGAEHQLRMAVKAEPENGRFVLALARFLASDGRTEAAVRLLERALARDTADEALLSLGLASLLSECPGGDHTGRMEELYRQTIIGCPNEALAYLGLGRLLVVQGRLEEARKRLERGLRLGPYVTWAHAARELVTTLTPAPVLACA